MQQFTNQDIADIKSRIDQIQNMLGGRGEEAVPGADERPVTLVDQITFGIQMRRMRRSHFGTAQLSGPSWDMMLDLMLARIHGRQLSASDLATGAGVPLSSGLRMIAALEQQGLLVRMIDEKDRRRSLVHLTDAGTEQMESYFEKVGRAWDDRRRRAA
ncbi:MarR family winged helix-turn-helix transcriptional regulator [Sphingopyxis indica]|uniref:DNA-binding transcriptional regulator, MarR family n=1 Tax=Sphingopyxis indica TaxID=436663 RepID=A0A239JCS3_9SPHN|nr:winged helix DNA-binding protein [Sphingopyxis indica]WOF43581.1 winged helix DNA-binding protein [Sphingopyxis indica]SNT03402.1 DNA-binding transcriptional regulator, MarR family [Sphingopyxis indica]